MSRLKVLLTAVLIAALPWLAGCSGGDDDASAEPSKVAESRPGVTDDLPAGFPKDQIPLIDAEVTTALETEEGYHVTVEPTTSYAAVLSGGEGGAGGKTSLTYLIEKLV